MTVQKVIPVKVTASDDPEGHRSYKVSYKVYLQIDDPTNPENVVTVRSAPGLPVVGSGFELGADSDPWAFCKPESSISPVGEEEGAQVWLVEKNFSTKPSDPSKQRCQDTPIEDPLLEPPKVNGTSTKYTEEATKDRYDNPVVNSAFEQIRGPQNEWDADRSQTVIEMNVAALDEAVLNAFLNHVNDRPLWTYNARCIKLSAWTFDRKFYNRCTVYYTVKLTFDKRNDTWDRDLLDEGTKVLNGEWVGSEYRVKNFSDGVRPDPSNPLHFIKFKDKNGENCKVILNGNGLPAGVTLGTQVNLITPQLISPLGGLIPIIAQPTGGPIYPRILVSIVDADNSISDGLLTITGQDEHGNNKTEVVDFSDAGTLIYDTEFRYSHVDSFVIVHTGAGAGDTISIYTATSQQEAGSIHVERYDEANFLLLGIPITY